MRRTALASDRETPSAPPESPARRLAATLDTLAAELRQLGIIRTVPQPLHPCSIGILHVHVTRGQQVIEVTRRTDLGPLDTIRLLETARELWAHLGFDPRHPDRFPFAGDPGWVRCRKGGWFTEIR